MVVAPPGVLDADAINVALQRLPQRLENEYRSKLAKHDVGTILELSLIGRLLQKADHLLCVAPWPGDRRVDADLLGLSAPAELEIKSDVTTLYERNIEGMCRRAEHAIRERWPDFRGDVHLHNTFVETTTAGGQTTLDVEATIKNILEALERFVRTDGTVRPGKASSGSTAPITKVDAGESVNVWVTTFTLPAVLDIEIAERVLKGALDDKHQFTKDRAAILAIIQRRDPHPDLLYVPGRDLSRKYFEKYPHLSAVVAIPCPSMNGPAVVISPDPDQVVTRLYPLAVPDLEQLADYFAVRLQKGPFWEAIEAELLAERDAERDAHDETRE